VNGGNGPETFTISANGTRVSVNGISPTAFTIDAGTIENIVINANGGDDTISAGNGLAALTSLTIDGGAGNDVITGGDGSDVLIGGTGNDTLIGSQGNDTLQGDDGNDVVVGGAGNDQASLGAGDDVFIWNPGDGSDTVEGQAGFDRLDFRGANINETIDISANGSRVLFSRDVGSVTMDLNGVERIDVHALGGADTIVINDLTGTDLTLVAVDLEGALGAGVGDGQLDQVIVNGTAGNDTINLLSIGGGAVLITGTPAAVGIVHADATDQLTVNGGAGNDTINASGLIANSIGLTLNGAPATTR
jgi:Ca2+-binding RTX toxin-like protein